MKSDSRVHFQATLAALTLTVGGVMILLFAADPKAFPLVVVLGAVLVVDGLYLAVGGMSARFTSSFKRYFFMWGIIMVIFGVMFFLTTAYSLASIIPYVFGALLVLLGVIALWSSTGK